MNREKTPKSFKRYSALDKLSSLPKQVIDRILIRLPIKDAVRTSVLSSKWRFNWTFMPDLVFDKDCFSFTRLQPPMVKIKLVNLIDRALLLHTGPISKFMLYQRDPISTTDLDRWILYLSRCCVQELILHISFGQNYKLHSCLFSFEDLVHLELFRCHLKLPSTFGGFKKLKSLNLRCVTAAQDVFETLISSCPILEKLTLWKVSALTKLNIDAPNLLYFNFEGYFDDIKFINSSNLATVTILLMANAANEIVRVRDCSNLLKFFSSLPRIKWLEIWGSFMEYLAIGDMPGQLPNPYLDLGYLYLDLNVNDYAESSAALCLLRSCPNIQELAIYVVESLEENELTVWEDKFTFWESEHKNCSFNKLQIVTIAGISGNECGPEFIRFMLLASPVLEKMTIKHTAEDQEMVLELATELLRFQRASTKAEVVFLGS